MGGEFVQSWLARGEAVKRPQVNATSEQSFNCRCDFCFLGSAPGGGYCNHMELGACLSPGLRNRSSHGIAVDREDTLVRSPIPPIHEILRAAANRPSRQVQAKRCYRFE